MAQLRFKENRLISENFYARGEGTQVYFFGQDEIHELWDSVGMVRVFRQKFTLEDVIGSHACSIEANMRVINGIPFG
jgi:tRNAThr (cytosine32-N3)-methyltransferase